MEKTVRIHNTLEEFIDAAARNVASILIEACNLRGKATIALSGGFTPAGVYKALAQKQYRDSVPWNSVHFFWGDERCVPPEDAESNYKFAVVNLLKAIPVNPENIHRIKGELGPQEAAVDYMKVLSEFAQGANPWPVFDLALMGMGEDGHTASLFPGTFNPGEDAMPVIQVNARYQDRPAYRVTLTPLVFNSSRNVIFLVAGETKAEAVQKVLSDQKDLKNIPAQRIQPADGNIIWHLDLAAGKYL